MESTGNVIPMDGFSLVLGCYFCDKSDPDPTVYGFSSWDEHDPFGDEWLICGDCMEDWGKTAAAGDAAKEGV